MFNCLKSTFCISELSERLTVFSKNRKAVFYSALISGCVISLLSVFFTYDLYRDVANVYAYYAREISMGNWQEGWVGRVPMLHIFLSGLLAKIKYLEPFRATLVISSLFYVLTLFPLRRFLERYLTPAWSAWGCVLFIFAPKLIRFSVSGLLEPIRYFFLIFSLLYFFRLSDGGRKWYEWIFLGLTLAGLAVSRGEGVLTAGLMLVGFPLFYLLKQRKTLKNLNVKKAFAGFLLTVFFFFAGLLPFCYGNWKVYGHFLPDLRLIECANFLKKNWSAEKKKTAKEQLDIKVNLLPQQKSRMKNILNTFRSTIRGGYEVYLSFALLGALILLRRRKWNWEFTAFIGLYLVHFVIYERIVTSYRYSIYLIPLFMPFTLTGLMFAGEKGREFLVKKQPGSLKYLPLFLGIGIVALFFIQAVNGMKCVTDRKDIPHHKAAAFIREYAEKNFPGRRCKIAALEDCVETLYWTGASSVWGYKEYEIHGKAFYRTDFDLLLSSRKEKQEFPASCGDLLEIQTPEDFPVRIFRKVEKNQ